mgnify:FL=1
MIKELKNLFFILIITLFIFLTLKYYFSNDNKKNSYRSLKTIDEKNLTFSQNLILLGDNTNDAVEYVKNTIDKNKKN